MSGQPGPAKSYGTQQTCLGVTSSSTSGPSTSITSFASLLSEPVSMLVAQFFWVIPLLFAIFCLFVLAWSPLTLLDKCFEHLVMLALQI
jgi:hypothetical protein